MDVTAEGSAYLHHHLSSPRTLWSYSLHCDDHTHTHTHTNNTHTDHRNYPIKKLRNKKLKPVAGSNQQALLACVRARTCGGQIKGGGKSGRNKSLLRTDGAGCKKRSRSLSLRFVCVCVCQRLY